MSKKLSVFFSILFCFISLAFAVDEVEPVVKEKLDGTKTCVFIKTDIPAVEVYFNGILQGSTDLVIRDLLPGLYNLDLVKPGYEKISCVISVKNGYSLEYSFTMEKIFGRLSLHNVPEGATVMVGNSVSSTKNSNDKDFVDCLLNVEPGEYKLRIEKFGFEKYSELIQIEANETTEVTVDLAEVPFMLSNFACDKASFNPDYSGHLGSCTCSFSVTANGAAKIVITDSTGREVWTKKFVHFTSWGQMFEWNGRDSSNNKLPDGQYCISITADGTYEEVFVTLDSTIKYPLFSVNKLGAGIGNVPIILTEQKKNVMPYFQGGVIKTDNSNSMCGIISAGLLSNFGKHFELNVAGTIFPGLDDFNRVDFAAALKVYNLTKLSAGILSYGGEISYVYQLKSLINLTAICGYDFAKWYAGAAYEYTVQPDSMGVLGFALAYKPVNSFRIGLWGLLLETYEAGIDLSFMPDSNAFIIDAKGGVEFVNEKPVVTIIFGLSYLF